MNQEEILRAKIRNPRSREEIRRRVELTLQAMKEEDVDLIIAQNDNKYLGGYVRWFLDIPAVQGYPMTVMLDKEGNMTSITHGAPDHPLLPECCRRFLWYPLLPVLQMPDPQEYQGYQRHRQAAFRLSQYFRSLHGP